MNTHKLVSVGATTALVFTLYGCGQPQTGASAATATATGSSSASSALTTSSEAASAPDVVDVAALVGGSASASYDDASAVHVTLADEGSSADGEGVSVQGSTVTIGAAGCYVLSGSLNGQVLVKAPADADVVLVLADASVSCATSAALRVKSAARVTLVLAPGSDNALATTGAFDDGNVDAAFFVKAPLCVCGTGALTIASTDIGITSRDTITLADGQVTIEASQHTLWADDGIAVTGGSYTLHAGHDGMHLENDERTDANCYVSGGSVTMSCAGDGIDAYGSVQVDGGSIAIDAQDQGIESTQDLLIRAGQVSVRSVNEALIAQGSQTVAEGVVKLS